MPGKSSFSRPCPARTRFSESPGQRIRRPKARRPKDRMRVPQPQEKTALKRRTQALRPLRSDRRDRLRHRTPEARASRKTTDTAPFFRRFFRSHAALIRKHRKPLSKQVRRRPAQDGNGAGRTQRPPHSRYPFSVLLLERAAGEDSKGGKIPPCFSRSSKRAQRSRSPAFSFHSRRFSAASSRRSSSRRSSLFSSRRQREQDACSSEMPSSAHSAAEAITSHESFMGPYPVRSHSRRTPVFEQIFSTTSVLGRFSFRS